MPFTSEKKFVDNHYLLRLGFIRSEKDPINNPDGLPIGFGRTFSKILWAFQIKLKPLVLLVLAATLVILYMMV